MSTTAPRPGTRQKRRTGNLPGSADRQRTSSSSLPQRGELQWRIYGYAVAVMVILFGLGALLVWRSPLAVIETITHARLTYAGFHDEYTTLEGQRIHYYEGGSSSGTPVLLVHGLGSRAEDWANLMPQLKQSGFHVYAIDLLGYGRSARPRDASYSVPQEAGFVDAFLDQKQIQKVDLVGWSMGGWVAARVALDRPERIGRLVLCDAAGIRFLPTFSVTDFEPTTIPAVRRLYRMLMPNAVDPPDFISRDMIRKFESLNWVVDRSARSMFKGSDILDGKLHALTMPTLIVWGKQDRLIPLSTGVVMHSEIAGSVLEIFDGCGHLAPGQCANRVGPHMIDFLSGRGPQPNQTTEIAAR